MHIVSRKALQQFSTKHPNAKIPLARWYKIVKNANFRSWNDVRVVFPSADKVGNKVVFNVGGNNYRLIVVMEFNKGRVFVRHVLTHQEYDRGNWKQ